METSQSNRTVEQKAITARPLEPRITEPHYFKRPAHPLTIQVIGCGGTGSKMLQNLARMNYAMLKLGHQGLHVNVWDHDTINIENLGRGLYNEGMLGMNKAEAVVTNINRYYGYSWTFDTEICGVTGMEKLLKYDSECNILITCVDDNHVRNKFCALVKKMPDQSNHRENGKYFWLDIGNSEYTGQILITDIERSRPEKLSTIHEHYGKLPINKSGPSCSLIEALHKQGLFINSMIAEYAGVMLWELLSKGELDYQGIVVNLKTMKTGKIPIQYR